MADVMPRRNLPSASEPWGRKVDSSLMVEGRGYDALKARVESDNRARAGQAGVIGRQIGTIADQVSDVNSRATQILEIGDLSITFPVPAGTGVYSGWVSDTFTVSAPPPPDGYTHAAFVFISGAALAIPTSQNIQVGSALELSKEGTVLSRSHNILAPVFASVPVGWTTVFQSSALTTVEPEGATLTLRLLCRAYRLIAGGPANVTGGLQGVRVFLVYGGRV